MSNTREDDSDESELEDMLMLIMQLHLALRKQFAASRERRVQLQKRRAAAQRRIEELSQQVKSHSSDNGKLPNNTGRNREQYGHLLSKDYFIKDPTYNEKQFRGRFRMSLHLFQRLATELPQHSAYFKQKNDACGLKGFTTEQKILTALTMLATGCSADSLDNRMRMAKTTVQQCVDKFCQAIVETYGEEYLRRPTIAEQRNLMAINKDRGFPGMIGSLDCMHWEWAACPKAWHDHYKGRGGKPTVVLEAACDQRLWIWHAYFGVPGAQNAQSILWNSTLFQDEPSGQSVPFSVGGQHFDRGYYLVDGMYPSWTTLIKAVKSPRTRQEKVFTTRQESARNDIERCFARLRNKWQILKQPCRRHHKEELHMIVRACIILHNMTIEDNEARDGTDCDDVCPRQAPAGSNRRKEAPPRMLPLKMGLDGLDPTLPEFERMRSMSNKDENARLLKALMEHAWTLKGQETEIDDASIRS